MAKSRHDEIQALKARIAQVEKDCDSWRTRNTLYYEMGLEQLAALRRQFDALLADSRYEQGRFPGPEE